MTDKERMEDAFHDDDDWDMEDDLLDASELDMHLTNLNFSVNEDLVRSFMFDELSVGKGSLDRALRRVFRGRMADFDEVFTVEDRNIMFLLIAEAWIDVKSLHSRGQPEELVKLRSQLLTVKEKILSFLRTIDRNYKPGDEKMLFSKDGLCLNNLDGIVDGGLSLLLNNPEDGEELKAIKSISRKIPEMETGIEELMNRLSPHLAKLALACADGMDETASEPSALLHLFDTSRKGSPRAVKALELPGSKTFENLAYALCDAWGLGDKDLYSFRLNPNGKFKGSSKNGGFAFAITHPCHEPEDERIDLDASQTCIADLNLKAGTELAFVHEAGDEVWFKVKFKGLR